MVEAFRAALYVIEQDHAVLQEVHLVVLVALEDHAAALAYSTGFDDLGVVLFLDEAYKLWAVFVALGFLLFVEGVLVLAVWFSTAAETEPIWMALACLEVGVDGLRALV